MRTRQLRRRRQLVGQHPQHLWTQAVHLVPSPRRRAMPQTRRRRLRTVALHLIAQPRPAAARTTSGCTNDSSTVHVEGWSPNSPRGSAEQGFGTGWADRTPHAQPPVFDPVEQFADACSFYDTHKYCVVRALEARWRRTSWPQNNVRRVRVALLYCVCPPLLLLLSVPSPLR
eukprot:COSAG02_NODE_1150_length_14208_cov_5.805231_2_plen_172_part_00